MVVSTIFVFLPQPAEMIQFDEKKSSGLKRDDTGKKITFPGKKKSRSLEKIFTAPGKEI